MEDMELIVAAEKKPSRGRGGKGNFPNAKVAVATDEDRALVGKLLTEVLVERKKERVKSDDELVTRLNDYFTQCATTGQVPTVEEMAMSTGYSISTVWDWEVGRNKGFSPETSEIIKKAKDVLKTFDAKLVISGKLNFLAYCFRAKNYYGMVDKAEYVLTPNQKQESDYNADEISKRYLTDVTTISD
jgi:hypothetical protein